MRSGLLYLLQRSGEPGLIARFEDEMDMVWHQAVRPARQTEPLARAPQTVAVIRVVLRLKKGLLATVAPLRHETGIAGQDEAGSAGHACIIATIPKNYNLCGMLGGINCVCPGCSLPKLPKFRAASIQLSSAVCIIVHEAIK